MRSAATWSVLAIAVMALSTAPSTASASRSVWSGAPDSTVGEPTETTPGTTPETEPDTPEPDDSVASTSTEETLIAAGEPDTDVDTTTTTIAIVGFVLLLAVASWWMVRRADPDAEPMPRDHPQPGPPSDLI